MMVDPTMFAKATSTIVQHPLISGCTAAVCTALTHVIGPEWIAYEVLFILVVIDVFTGFMNALKRKNVSSVRFFQKGVYLLLYFFILISAHQVERIMEIPFVDLEVWTAYFLAVGEFISILENSKKLGIPFPQWIKTRLEEIINTDPSK